MSFAARIVGSGDHALLGLVLDDTYDCIKLLDADGRIEFVNRRGAEAMELRTPEELIGQLWVNRWPSAGRQKVQEALECARSGEKSRFRAMRPRADGSSSWWDVTVAAVHGGDGAFTHFLTIARDITSEVTEGERVQAISAEMRHRLRNALAIAGALVNMSARGRPDDIQTFATEVTDRFARLSRVQGMILDPGTGKRFGEIVSMLAGAYGEGVFEFGMLPDVELGDAALQALALSFGELCTNSLKYGALSIGASVRVEAMAAGRLCTLLWSEETNFKTPRDGGQGLALMDRIVRSTGGKVERTSDGHTLIVRISLPTAMVRREATR